MRCLLIIHLILKRAVGVGKEARGCIFLRWEMRGGIRILRIINSIRAGIIIRVVGAGVVGLLVNSF
jgi:hypothetical protein